MADRSKAVTLLMLIYCSLLLLMFVGDVFGSCFVMQLRNEFDFWKVHGTMDILGLMQSKASR